MAGAYIKLMQETAKKRQSVLDNPQALQTALSPTAMPTPGDAQTAKASLAAQRTVKRRKGRASTILTRLFGQGGLSAPITALSAAPTGTPSMASVLDVGRPTVDLDFWSEVRPGGPGIPRRLRR